MTDGVTGHTTHMSPACLSHSRREPSCLHVTHWAATDAPCLFTQFVQFHLIVERRGWFAGSGEQRETLPGVRASWQPRLVAVKVLKRWDKKPEAAGGVLSLLMDHYIDIAAHDNPALCCCSFRTKENVSGSQSHCSNASITPIRSLQRNSPPLAIHIWSQNVSTNLIWVWGSWLMIFFFLFLRISFFAIACDIQLQMFHLFHFTIPGGLIPEPSWGHM